MSPRTKHVVDTELVTVVRAAGLAVVFAAGLAACDRPPPRTFNDFMEDSIAREGTLARCNQDRDATLNDLECANARRAAAAVAVREERERQARLALESQRKLLALRADAARQQEAEERAAAEGAYEAHWRDAKAPAPSQDVPPTGNEHAAGPAPAFGAPIGAPLPSIAADHIHTAFGTPAAAATGSAVPPDELPSAAASTAVAPNPAAAPPGAPLTPGTVPPASATPAPGAVSAVPAGATPETPAAPQAPPAAEAPAAADTVAAPSGSPSPSSEPPPAAIPRPFLHQEDTASATP